MRQHLGDFDPAVQFRKRKTVKIMKKVSPIFDPKDDESRAMAEFNEQVNSDSRAEKLFLTIRDGIYLIRKR